MKAFLLTILVILLAMTATLLLVSLGTFIALNFSQWGRTILAGGRNSSLIWPAILSGARQLFLYVLVPTVLFVGFMVGVFAKRLPSIAAALSVLPISLATSYGWEIIELVFASMLAALVASKLTARRDAMRMIS